MKTFNRITPIYMGNTAGLIRVRLEGGGSPPYTWGIPVSYIPRVLVPRITPIYMGNTIFQRFRKTWTRDHPHIHGEYQGHRVS